MATAVEKAIDVAADVAEEVAEESTQVAEATRALSPRDVGLVFGGIGIGAVAGFVVGGLIMNKKLRTKYEQIADEEIANMKVHYDKKLTALDNDREKQTIESVQQEIKDKVEGGKDGEPVTPYHQMYKGDADEKEPTAENVFDKDEDPEVEMSDSWNIEEELALRTANPGVPYVIHRNEHEEGPGVEEYEKFTLTYFEGDDVLCRDDDTVIEDQDEIVGLGNLSRFGHGSGDPNIVYIRNDKLKVDLEVVHSDGAYATEVHGFQPDELKHSSMRRRSPRRSEFESDD